MSAALLTDVRAAIMSSSEEAECSLKPSRNFIWKDIEIQSRASDNFINATQMCKAGGKRFSSWHALDSTKELIRTLESDISDGHTKRIKAVDIKRGNSSHYVQGSWIHPRLATSLATWISPAFAVKISEWIEEWKAISPLNNQKYFDELSRLKPSERTLREAALRDKYQALLNATAEVETDVGLIDLLTSTAIVELKTAACWKHGVGQLICYGSQSPYENREKWLYLFDYGSFSAKTKSIVERTCQKNGIMIKYID